MTLALQDPSALPDLASDYRLTEQPVDNYLLQLGLWDAHFNEQRFLVRAETPLVARYQQYVQGKGRRDL